VTAATDAYGRLSAAMDDTRPACADDDRFTADTPSEADLEDMRGICAACPLLAVCDAYRVAASPRAAFWAGHPTKTTRTRSTKREQP